MITTRPNNIILDLLDYLGYTPVLLSRNYFNNYLQIYPKFKHYTDCSPNSCDYILNTVDTIKILLNNADSTQLIYY